MKEFKLLDFLKKPHPFIFTKGGLLLVLAVTFFLLFFLKPFGYDVLPTMYRASLAMGNGVVATFGVWVSVNAIKRVLPNWSKPERWTIGKELVLIFVTIANIALMTFLFMWATGLFDDSPATLFKEVVLKSFVASILPVVLLVLFEQYDHQRKKLKQAIALDLKIKASAPKQTTLGLMDIKNENGSIALRVAPSELVFIQSEGNYLEVYYYQNKLKKQLVRNSLKALVSDFEASQLFQCHKSYLVNVKQVVKVNGNARNLTLTLRYVETPIPVSRTKTKLLEDLLM